MTRTDDPTTSMDARGPAAFDELMRREQESVRISFNQPLYLPGVFQIEGYAAEMIGRIRALEPGDPELQERVDARMRRAAALADRLRGDAPPQVSVVTEEGVLRRVVGGPKVMRQQLDRLRELSGLPSVELAIVPARYGAYPGGDASFEVHEDANGDAAVYFEGHEDAIVINNEAETQRCRRIVATLRESVVSGADARALLETISREW
jgi:hypothetical protein